MILVQDTKKPDKAPFETSQAGFEGLRKAFGNRYVSLEKAIVTPDKIEIKKVIVPNPKGKK